MDKNLIIELLKTSISGLVSLQIVNTTNAMLPKLGHVLINIGNKLIKPSEWISHVFGTIFLCLILLLLV